MVSILSLFLPTFTTYEVCLVETSASGLATTSAYLALYPDTQQAAFEEISRAFAEKKGPKERIDPSQLAYTYCCFLEAQMLVPTSFIVPRKATQDLIVHITRPQPGTIHIKEGTLIVFDLIGTHRDPNIFKDPEIFRPERWIGVKERDDAMFGLGHRSCIHSYPVPSCVLPCFHDVYYPYPRGRQDGGSHRRRACVSWPRFCASGEWNRSSARNKDTRRRSGQKLCSNKQD